MNLRKYKWALSAGLIFGISSLSGHPQILLYESLFLILLFVWYFIHDIKNKILNGRTIIHFILAGALPLIIAFGIFAIQYLPSQELAKLSRRSEQSFEKAAEGSLKFKQIYTTITPKLFGFVDGKNDKTAPFHLDDSPYYFYWDTAFYSGLCALFLGLFGMLTNFKSKEGSFLIFISIFGFLFALGSNFFLFELFYNLPFFGLLRIPARIMFFFGIGMCLLAGFGFDELSNQIRQTICSVFQCAHISQALSPCFAMRG